MKEEYSNKIIERLRIFRDTRNLSQQQLADRFSVPRTTISKWENGNAAIPGWVAAYLYSCATEKEKV